jgi:peptide/nickel transport system permease protein
VLLMVLVALYAAQPGSSAVIGIALISWPQVARVVRGEFLSLRSREICQAAQVLGMRDAHHFHPDPAQRPAAHCGGQSMMVGSAILTEVGR